MYIDGGVHHEMGNAPWARKPIQGGGEVVLGQSSRTRETNNEFKNHSAFLGEMGQVNIWKRVLNASEVSQSIGSLLILSVRLISTDIGTFLFLMIYRLQLLVNE